MSIYPTNSTEHVQAEVAYVACTAADAFLIKQRTMRTASFVQFKTYQNISSIKTWEFFKGMKEL